MALLSVRVCVCVLPVDPPVLAAAAQPVSVCVWFVSLMLVCPVPILYYCLPPPVCLSQCN